MIANFEMFDNYFYAIDKREQLMSLMQVWPDLKPESATALPL